MSKTFLLTLLALLCLACNLNAQTDSINYHSGIWQYLGSNVDKQEYPEINGRLSNFRWKDIERLPGVWDWTEMDSEFTAKAADSLPIIFMVYTKEDAPDWLWSNGVPKVLETDDAGMVTGFAPYYADPTYKMYFERMISAVSAHVRTLPENIRNKIIGVQGCFGSTGDYISYKGNVPSQYKLSSDDFFSLFKEFTQYYYDEYRLNNPHIKVLSNPSNSGDDQTIWVMQNCPGFLKTGTLGKGFQLNGEKTKAAWLYPLMNNPQAGGEYARVRCEIIGANLQSGWWLKFPYKNMFALMCYGIHWGLDWSNQGIDQIKDCNFDSAFSFFNKYSGQKDPATATNALCAFKDVLDAADVSRFPESKYGTASDTNRQRFKNIAAEYAGYGAQLEDADAATSGEMDNINASGTNDVGWDLIEGNYERYLHQINANATSAGYWNIPSRDSITMYGRFGRGFDHANGKNALYFDVDDAFLRNQPVKGAYAIMIEVTYLDSGTGKFQLYYDANNDSNKASLSVTCTNTGVWKKMGITLKDAYFGNRGVNGADFYIKNTGSGNVIFAVVELTRPDATNSNTGITATPVSFAPLCANSISDSSSFILSGMFLTGDRIKVGPLKGFSFATTADSVYKDSLKLVGYGASLKQTIYVKFHPTEGRSYDGNIPVKGGGTKLLNVPVTAIGTNPATLSAAITDITCYNARNGSIDLSATNATDPVSYSWTSTDGFKASTADISSLKPSTYTVSVKSGGGCISTATYMVSQPDVLKVSLSADPIVCKGGTTNLYVQASGGTQPYNGTGTFSVGSGYKTYTVTDAHGCSGKSSLSVANGTLTAPSKPTSITGTGADATGLCGGGKFLYTVSQVSSATFYTWTPPAGCSITSNNSDASSVTLHAPSTFTTGTLSVSAGNVCGSSNPVSKSLTVVPGKPGSISGPSTVTANQKGINYSVSASTGVVYTWTVPGSSSITAGQNTAAITVTWGTKPGYVTVTANNNCGTSAQRNLYVNLSATATAKTLSSSLATPVIYPNPVRDIATVSFTTAVEYRFSMQLHDLTGRIVAEKTGIASTGTNNIGWNISGLPAGVYIMQWMDANDTMQTLKVLKE